MKKAVVLTGLRSNENLTIGNYFGALLPLVEMANNKSDEFDIHLFVPDLHSFTTSIDHTKLYDQTINNLKMYVAAGLPLDKTNVHIYRQSFIPAHSELTWILDCFSGFGELSRMTQFKDKSKKEPNISVGLFNYPVLMAADILLYDAIYVPVGDDQTQHLEFTRDIAMRFNSKFSKDIFTVPAEVKKQHSFFGREKGLRIMDLADPSKKMSKSDVASKGVIYLADDPNTASKKILSATTDNLGQINLDKENQPGISNILEILALFKNESVQEITKSWEGKSSYKELKEELANVTKEFLIDFQSKLESIKTEEIENKLQKSEEQLRITANKKLEIVQKAVGLRK